MLHICIHQSRDGGHWHCSDIILVVFRSFFQTTVFGNFMVLVHVNSITDVNLICKQKKDSSSCNRHAFIFDSMMTASRACTVSVGEIKNVQDRLISDILSLYRCFNFLAVFDEFVFLFFRHNSMNRLPSVWK